MKKQPERPNTDLLRIQQTEYPNIQIFSQASRDNMWIDFTKKNLKFHKSQNPLNPTGKFIYYSSLILGIILPSIILTEYYRKPEMLNNFPLLVVLIIIYSALCIVYLYTLFEKVSAWTPYSRQINPNEIQSLYIPERISQVFNLHPNLQNRLGILEYGLSTTNCRVIKHQRLPLVWLFYITIAGDKYFIDYTDPQPQDIQQY